MTSPETLLQELGIETYGFARQAGVDGRSSLVMLFPYDPRPAPILDHAIAAPEATRLSIGAFAAVNHYAAMVRLLKVVARRLGGERGLAKSDFQIGVNSGLAEKELALSAGLGFIGRSSLLISHAYGPACLIGVLQMPDSCVVPGEAALSASGKKTEAQTCGDCSLCAQACPVGAIGLGGYTREKCLQHWMSRDDFPDSLVSARGKRLYGCDECIRACPHSSGAWQGGAAARARALLLPAELSPGFELDAAALAGKDAPAVKNYFHGTALAMGWMPHEAWAVFAGKIAGGR